MPTITNDLIKVREICLAPGAQGRTAYQAALLLCDLAGIEHVVALDARRLEVGYRLPRLWLQVVEDCLSEIGFELDRGVLIGLRRAIIHYTEETQLANLGQGRGMAAATRDMFVHQYQQRLHGCRDERPKHERQYL